MAHLAKFKAPAVGHMLAHYRRTMDIEKRNNIDAERTGDNFIVAKVGDRYMVPECDPPYTWNTIAGRISRVERATGRKLRKDAVVMADIVVTKPKNVPDEDTRAFFIAAYESIARMVGEDNMLAGYVHMDETTPHMHAPFTPISNGRFNFKKVCPQSFYKSLHTRLERDLTSALGYTPEVILGQDQIAEKLISKVGQDKIDAARRAIVDPIKAEQRAAEGARDAAIGAAAHAEDVAERAKRKAIADVEAAAARASAAEERAATAEREAAARASEAEAKAAEAEARAAEAEARLEGLQEACGIEEARAGRFEALFKAAQASRGAGGFKRERGRLEGAIAELERAIAAAERSLLQAQERLAKVVAGLLGRLATVTADTGEAWEQVYFGWSPETKRVVEEHGGDLAPVRRRYFERKEQREAALEGARDAWEVPPRARPRSGRAEFDR